MTKIKLGDRVKDKLTGFEGNVEAISKYLYGCTQVCVQPEVDDKGNWIKHQWFDEPQIEKVKQTNGKAKDEFKKMKEMTPRYGKLNKKHPED